MSDDEATREVLGAVKAAVPDIRMHTPVQHIVSAARSRRRRRGLTRLAVAGLAVAVGLTLGLSTPGSGRNTPEAQPHGAKLAAWTVRTGPGGAVTITLRQLSNPAALQHALAEHGVPAIVHVGDSICFQSDGHPLPGLFRVVTHPPGFPIVIRIRPAAMPHGSELLFSLTRSPGTVAYVGQELIRIGAPLSCLHPPSYHSSTNPPPAKS
jgi:hypothetical protein